MVIVLFRWRLQGNERGAVQLGMAQHGENTASPIVA
jgi:hypothetical protein